MKISSYVRLMRLHRPWPILLLLWPTLWALWIAGEGRPGIKNIIIFILGVLVMRSAGCVINDIADRHFDRQVKRTQKRPLATGELSLQSAWVLFGLLVSIALILVLQLNRLTLLLSPIALFLGMIYPFMKRYTYFPQLFLGLAWYMSIPMAFASVQGHLSWLALWIYLLATLYAVIYDTFYAMADREDDLKAGIKSTAILFAQWDCFIIAILQVIFILGFIALGLSLNMKPFYYVCIAAASAHFIYQQVLVRKHQAYIQAFINNHWVGAWIFLGFLLSY